MVAAAGHLRRPAMYMSKNAMASIWSWDNCFNALALVPHQPELAWDQLMVMVDLQDMDYAEAAASLGIPLGTFKSRLARARQQLQKWLNSAEE